MSFSSFSLFNFYQQPNTGFQPIIPNTGIVVSGNSESGKVADYNWYFPYVNTNVQSALVFSQNQFLQYNIFSDAFNTIPIGLFFPTFSSSFSGEFNSQRDLGSITGVIYGQIFPLLMDLSFTESSFSGLLTGTKPDSTSQLSSWSGFFSGRKFDIGYFSSSFSGEFTKAGDSEWINSSFSGMVNQQKQDNESISINTTGRFWQTKNDHAAIGYSLVGYLMGLNAPIVNYSGQDRINSISYAMVNVVIAGSS